MSIQGRAVKRAALPAVFVVATAWWAALTVYEAASYPAWFVSNLGVLFNHAWKTMLMVVYGSVAGVGIALFVAHVKRQDMERSLEGESFRNLTTTMGAIPISATEPARGAVIPVLSKHGEVGEKVGAWLRAMGRISPAHAKLFEALLRVLNHDPQLPATHVPGGHGGKSLLQHSLLVTQAMLEMAPSWSYEGQKNKKEEVVIGLRNPAYVFNSSDPILGIVALAHDLGKIECYIKDGAGKVVDSRHAHDVVSGRMIARMPEFWLLSKEDRDAIILAISHYHHPQDLPMHEDGRAIDDRTIAVLELLIKADKAAGKIESGTTYANTMGLEGGTGDSENSPAAKLVDDETLYKAFIELIHEPGRINGKEASIRVGQKHGGLLYFAETALRVAMIRKLGLSSSPSLGDGRSALTVQLMELLSVRGLLVQEHDGKSYSFKRAMFRVAFFNSKTNKHLADWPAVLIVNPGSSLPQISSMKDHLSRVEITRPVWGESSAKSKTATVLPPLDLDDAGEAPGAESNEVEPAAALSIVGEPVAEQEGLLDVFASFNEPEVPPAPPAPGPVPDDEDDFIGALVGEGLSGAEKDNSTIDMWGEPASSPGANMWDNMAPPPDIQEEEDSQSLSSEAADESIDAFNRVARKLGDSKPLKGLDKGHLERLGDKLQGGVDAALANLEKKASGKPYSRAMLLVEKEKLRELLKAGAITLYASPKGDLLALDEVAAARARFGWDEAVSEAESGEQDIFAVVRAGERTFLKFSDFQKKDKK